MSTTADMITTRDGRPVVTQFDVVRTVGEAETELVETMARLRVTGRYGMRRPRDVADRDLLLEVLVDTCGVTVRVLLRGLRPRVREVAARFRVEMGERDG